MMDAPPHLQASNASVSNAEIEPAKIAKLRAKAAHQRAKLMRLADEVVRRAAKLKLGQNDIPVDDLIWLGVLDGEEDICVEDLTKELIGLDVLDREHVAPQREEAE